MQRFNLSLHPELLEKLDQAAKAEYTTRSEFIRQAVIEKLQRTADLTRPIDIAIIDDESLQNATKLLRDEQLKRALRAEKPDAPQG